MAHTCDRDSCPTASISGPKAKCFACKKLCYLNCYGIPSTIIQLAAHDVSSGTKVNHLSPSSCIQFICALCLSSSSGQPSQPTQPNQSSQLNDSVTTPKSRLTIASIMNEVSKLHDQVVHLQSSNADINAKLDGIDTKTTKIELNTTEIKTTTEAVLCEVNTKSTNLDVNTASRFSSPSQVSSPSSRPFRPNLNHGKTTKTFAQLFHGTPSSSKRRRLDEPAAQIKPDVPQPKVGTNANVGRLVAVSVAPKSAPKKTTEKPRFEKAVWVSRLPPATTEDEIREHIATLQTVSSNFTVHKLVKKDRALSELNFVSFKIAVNMDDFAILNDPSAWPTGVLVREFMESKPMTFGNFLPNNLNEKASRPSTENPETMEVQQQSPSQQLIAAQNVT